MNLNVNAISPTQLHIFQVENRGRHSADVQLAVEKLSTAIKERALRNPTMPHVVEVKAFLTDEEIEQVAEYFRRAGWQSVKCEDVYVAINEAQTIRLTLS